MIKCIFSILFSALLLNCKMSSFDCSRFRKGRFMYHTEDMKVFIVRNDSLQFEKNAKTGKVDTLKISWTGPCSYDLSNLSSFNPYPHMPDSIFRKPLHTVILNSTKQYYCFEATKAGISLIYRDTIWVIH